MIAMLDKVSYEQKRITILSDPYIFSLFVRRRDACRILEGNSFLSITVIGFYIDEAG